MNPTTKLLHLNSHDQEVIESERNSVQEICTVPHSLNDINLSPVSIQHISHLPEISSPKAQEGKRLNKFILDRGDRKQETLNKTRTRLPTIHNPKAEDRLRALIELLGKKNPNIPQNDLHQIKRNKTGQEASVEEARKVHLVLPPLTSFTPKPIKQKEIEDMKKLFARSPARKPIFKIPEAAESKESTQRIKLIPNLLAPILTENQQPSERNISVQIKERRRIVVRNYSQNTSVEKNSPNESGESERYKKLVVRKAKKEDKDEKPSIKRPLPDVKVNFDMRIHKVSIDDALERLIQLTNQSDNARKDLLKIQENALAVRLSCERNHKNFDRVTSKKDSRNH